MSNQCENSQIEYKGTGQQKLFTFPFTYLKQSDVYVELYDSNNNVWVPASNPTSWVFANATTIEFKQAPVTPSNGEPNIKIYRNTDVNPLTAQFNPGSAIRAVDLNDNFEQLQMAIEENKCNMYDVSRDTVRDLYLNRIDVDDQNAVLDGDLVKSTSTLTINDEVVATTKWIDNRYWDQCEETTATYDTWVDELDDAHIPTTGAVENRLVQIIKNGGFGLPSVVSVNGKAGVVSLGLGDLTDVDTTSGGHVPTNGQALVWDASMNHWMPGTVSGGVPEAPVDGKQYGRQNASWTEIISTGGGGTSLWQQQGDTLSPVASTADLSIPGGAVFTGKVQATGYRIDQLPMLP